MSPITRPSLSDLSLILLTALIWASSFSALKVAVLAIGPVWTVTARVSIGFAALLAISLASGRKLPGRDAPWGMIAAIAMLNIVIPFLLISWALNHVPSGVAALLMGTGPFTAMVLSHFLTLDDRINGFKLLAVLLGLSGIVTMIGVDALHELDTSAVIAQLGIILGSVCYVVSGHLMRRLDISPVPFTTVALGAASLILIGFSLAWAGIPERVPAPGILAILLWLGLFPTGLAYVLRFYLVRKVGLSTFAVGMNLVPVLGVLIGAMVLNEAIELKILIALAFVMSGLFAARLAVRAEPPKRERV